MTIKICPRCNKRYVVQPHTSDYIHQCDDFSTSTAISQEDILVLGDWEDYTGSGTTNPQEVMRQGGDNKLFGTRAQIEGEKPLHDLTQRGNPKSVYRTRSHEEYILD